MYYDVYISLKSKHIYYDVYDNQGAAFFKNLVMMGHELIRKHDGFLLDVSTVVLYQSFTNRKLDNIYNFKTCFYIFLQILFFHFFLFNFIVFYFITTKHCVTTVRIKRNPRDN